MNKALDIKELLLVSLVKGLVENQVAYSKFYLLPCIYMCICMYVYIYIYIYLTRNEAFH